MTNNGIQFEDAGPSKLFWALVGTAFVVLGVYLLVCCKQVANNHNVSTELYLGLGVASALSLFMGGASLWAAFKEK